ncbi:MAG: hypothetical protein PVI74_15795, partial [Syntrophobacterales bacterium]
PMEVNLYPSRPQFSRAKKYLFNIENLVLKARSECNGLADTGARSFGVLEYWSTGVLAKTKAGI